MTLAKWQFTIDTRYSFCDLRTSSKSRFDIPIELSLNVFLIKFKLTELNVLFVN